MSPPLFRVKLDPSAVQKSEPVGDCKDKNSHLEGLPSLGNSDLLFPGDFSHQRQIQVWIWTVIFFPPSSQEQKGKAGGEHNLLREEYTEFLLASHLCSDRCHFVSVNTSVCSLKKLSGNLFKIKNPEVMPLEALCAYESFRQSEILVFVLRWS